MATDDSRETNHAMMHGTPREGDPMPEYRAATIDRLLSSPKFPELAAKLQHCRRCHRSGAARRRNGDYRRANDNDRHDLALQLLLGAFYGMASSFSSCCTTHTPCRNSRSTARAVTIARGARAAPPSRPTTTLLGRIRQAYSRPPRLPGHWPAATASSLASAACSITASYPRQRGEGHEFSALSRTGTCVSGNLSTSGAADR